MYISVFCACFAITARAQTSSLDPDALYRDREQIAKARQAADTWESQLEADPRNFEAAWKLARAYYWLGTHGPQDHRRADLERGITAAEQADLVKRLEAAGFSMPGLGKLAAE